MERKSWKKSIPVKIMAVLAAIAAAAGVIRHRPGR